MCLTRKTGEQYNPLGFARLLWLDEAMPFQPVLDSLEALLLAECFAEHLQAIG